jgi:N utilization substance protein A
VIVDEADGRMELVVPDEKLSLAIGRKGQNVRLAAQLSGWKLDIISDTKFKQMEEEAVGQLQQVEGISEAIARSMYRLGFRTLEELAEASEQELATIPGIGGNEASARVRTGAETTMERLRQDRIRAASSRVEPLTEHERLLFIRGVGERTVQLLEDAGYRSVEELLREDEDKLAIKTGLGIRKARAIKLGAEQFLSGDAKTIEAARRESAARAREAAKQAPAS